MTKKILELLVLCVVSILPAQAQFAKVALSHEGNVTLFETIKTALNAAVDGDTLYLNEGRFAGDVVITKNVALIGAGPNTIIAQGISIQIPGIPTARVLDGMKIEGSVGVLSDGVVIRKCAMTSMTIGKSGFYVDDLVIDRCYIGTSIAINSAKKMAVYNSRVTSPYGRSYDYVATDLKFVNCNVRLSDYTYNTIKALFINSIVCDFAQVSTGSVCVNCYLRTEADPNNHQDCVYDISSSNSYAATYATMEETGAGMTGSDGTPLGITGGATPYTLVPSSPVVTSRELKMIPEANRLNVTIQVESR